MTGLSLSELLLVGVFCHMLGDYVFQSHWMAIEKTQKWGAAVAHAAAYTAPFVVITRNPLALLIIGGTHAVIDRYRLARYVVWAKNFLAPRHAWQPWRECSITGYPANAPVWLTTWLMILADNTLHIGINSATLWWLR